MSSVVPIIRAARPALVSPVHACIDERAGRSTRVAPMRLDLVKTLTGTVSFADAATLLFLRAA
jgi:hypothetical protein